MSSFNKPALSIDDQISLLERRGLVVADRNRAKQYLSYISYYRLSGYAVLLETEPVGSVARTHLFKPGATFDSLIELYAFDRRLRLLLIDAIERIEVALRTLLCNSLSQKYGPHWFIGASGFKPDFNHGRLLKTIREETGKDEPGRQNDSCKHCYNSYAYPEFPPCWMVAEVLSMGMWSMVFSGLRGSDQKMVARLLNLSPDELRSWFHALSSIRNRAAHHGRLVGHYPIIRPRHSKKLPSGLPTHTFSALAAVVFLLLRKIVPGSTWALRLHSLFDKNPDVDVKRFLGFSADWWTDPFWALI